jgi:hypothetical protein
MALTPTNAPDSLIKELFGDNEGVAKAAAAAMERLLNVMPKLNAETLANGRTNDLLVYAQNENGKLVTRSIPRPEGHDAMLKAEREARLAHARRHAELVRQEITERGLTEIDPDWRDRFSDWKAAELFYVKELNPGYPAAYSRIVNGGGGTQPDETEEIPYRDPDEDVDFDADLEDRDER